MNLIEPSLEGFLWVAAITLTILLLDLFFETAYLSIASLIGVSFYFSAICNVDLKWQLLIFLICWLSTTFLYFLFCKAVLLPLVKKLLPQGYKESIHSAIGDSAVFRVINDKNFACWNGDLWEVTFDKNLSFLDNEVVIISKNKDGVLTIQKQK